jgi:hypothetical protein
MSVRPSYRLFCWFRFRRHQWETLHFYFSAAAAQQRCKSCGCFRTVAGGR